MSNADDYIGAELAKLKRLADKVEAAEKEPDGDKKFLLELEAQKEFFVFIGWLDPDGKRVFE